MPPMDTQKITMEDFIDHVGQKRLRLGCDISEPLMSRYKSRGWFPASRYFTIRDWCVANKIDVPDHLFDPKNVSVQPTSAKLADDQDAVQKHTVS